MKNISDYLHLYLGCDIIRPDGKTVLKMIGITENVIEFESEQTGEMYGDIKTVKPLLRPLSDMSEEEAKEGNLSALEYTCIKKEILSYAFVPKTFLWLLSKHFDLFGLIEAGLAIDKNTLK